MSDLCFRLCSACCSSDFRLLLGFPIFLVNWFSSVDQTALMYISKLESLSFGGIQELGILNWALWLLLLISVDGSF